MNTDRDPLTEAIIGCAFRVSNTLGTGFLEKVYETALAVELRKCGLAAEQQCLVQVLYDGTVVGDYRADIIVNDRVVVEVKAARALDSTHEAQLLNYLRAARLTIGLLLNFGTSQVGIKRMISG
jgi:GxxExxY protein